MGVNESFREGAAVNINVFILLTIILFSFGCTLKTSDELYVDGVKSVRTGKFNDAIVLLRKALEKNHNHLDARYELAMVYVSVGRYELAEKEFQKVKLMSARWF